MIGEFCIILDFRDFGDYVTYQKFMSLSICLGSWLKLGRVIVRSGELG